MKSQGVVLTDDVRSYLKEIGRIPLLSPDEELKLARDVQSMLVLQQQIENIQSEISPKPSLSETLEILGVTADKYDFICKKGQRAKDKMASANLRLVVSIAKKYQNRGVAFLDLIQEGSLGLMRGIEKFDPEKGYKLSTYATWWIRQAITRAVATQARTIRLPIHVVEKANKVKKAARILTQQLGRTPNNQELLAELAAHHGVYMTLEKLLELRKNLAQPLALNQVVGQERDTELGDLIADGDSDDPVMDWLSSGLLREELLALVNTLPAKQRTAIVLRFGLEDGKQLSLAQVGTILNVSRERARQLEKNGLIQLRRKVSSRDLDGFNLFLENN